MQMIELNRWKLAWVCAALVVVHSGAFAQDDPSEPDAPVAPSDPVAPDADVPNGSVEASALLAEDLARTAFTAPTYRADGFGSEGPQVQAALLAEGSFLSDRRGILVPVGERDWGFVFDADAQGRADRPMLLQPCLRLAEMVRLRASRNRTATFVISGRVMIYQGVNALMPEEARLLPTEGMAEQDGEEADRMVAANRVLDPNGGDPSVDELLARIESARGDGERGLAGSELDDAAAQARGDLMPEGASIVSRRGRVIRGNSGMLVFVQDGDDGVLKPSAGELVLMRCRNLEAIEQLWQRGGDSFSLIISGPVTVFEGTNYLLPLMYVVESRRGGGITSAQ